MTDEELRQSLADVNRAFTEFQSKNDRRLAEIEKRGAADVLTHDQVERINTAITEMRARVDAAEARASRPGAPADPKADPEYRAEFRRYLSRGEVSARMEQRAMSVGSNSDGGFLASAEIQSQIEAAVRNVSPIRQICTVRTTGASVYKVIGSKSNSTAGWVGEAAARPETPTSDLMQMEFPAQEMYANAWATQSILDDVDGVEAFIAEETQSAFAEAEGLAAISGNGVGQIRGFLSLAHVVESGSTVAAHGKLGVIKTGNATSLGSADKLIDVYAALKTPYRANARWVFNRKTEAEIRKLKDSTGQYLWQPSMQAGQPASLFGYPITLMDHMPDIGDGNVPVAYGDFRAGYILVDHTGVRLLRDPYTNKPYVNFYTTKRVGGGSKKTEAIKGLKTQA